MKAIILSVNQRLNACTVVRSRNFRVTSKTGLLFGPNQSFLGEGDGTPLQYSCLENPMDGGAWWAAVHGVAKSKTQLSDFTFTFHVHALEKEMAAHSCVLAWRIPGTGEPGGLPLMGLHRVRHDWSDVAAAEELSLFIKPTILEFLIASFLLWGQFLGFSSQLF